MANEYCVAMCPRFCVQNPINVASVYLLGEDYNMTDLYRAVLEISHRLKFMVRSEC
jgi:hypothetical protein